MPRWCSPRRQILTLLPCAKFPSSCLHEDQSLFRAGELGTVTAASFVDQSCAIVWPLWHVTRIGACVGAPCDPHQYLPFGGLAAGLTILGAVALVGIVVVPTVTFQHGSKS